jgi:hypothetical protein
MQSTTMVAHDLRKMLGRFSRGLGLWRSFDTLRGEALLQYSSQIDDILLGLGRWFGRLLAFAFGVDHGDQRILIGIFELRRIELRDLLVDQEPGKFRADPCRISGSSGR